MTRTNKKTPTTAKSPPMLAAPLFLFFLFGSGFIIGYFSIEQNTIELESSHCVSSTEGKTLSVSRSTTTTESSATSESSGAKNSNARFVFLIGTEGSGHELYHDVFNISNAKDQLLTWDLSVELNELTSVLWNKGGYSDSEYRIRSDSCPGEESTNNSTNEEKEYMTDTRMDNLVEILKKIDNKIGAQEQEGKKQMAYVPLNPMPHLSGHKPHTQPHSRCRSLQYPDINIVYDACDRAGVVCQHIVLLRNIKDSIQSLVSFSSSRANQYPPVHHQVRGIIPIFDVINSQILAYPERLLACWDYDEFASRDDDVKNNGGMNEVGKLLGWEDEEEFKSVYERIHKIRKDEEGLDSNLDFPEMLAPQVKTAVRSQDRIRQTCLEHYRMKSIN